MIRMTLGEIAERAGGKLNDEKFRDIDVRGVSIDTRTLDVGNLYVPIIGEKLDGHRFIEAAFEKGAVGSMVDEKHPIEADGRAYVIVEDTTKAYQQLAASYRDSLSLKIIGITGSNGKTTTKDIMASVLGKKLKVTKTIGNLNNHIGVPKTLLNLSPSTEVGIIEMGTERFGEISELTRMAHPDIAMITNIGDCHLEELLTRENIAKAKLEILEGMPKDGTFLYNWDDPVLRKAVADREIEQRVLTFGTEEGADYRLELVHADITGTIFKLNGEEYEVNLLGNHQMYNAACAIIVAKLFGLDDATIREGLYVRDTTSMRSELLNCQGFDILNDCYKSNPQSLLEAFETMSLLTGYTRKIAIIGDMLELGEREKELHYEVGTKINPNDIDYLLCYGPLSEEIARGAKVNFPNYRVAHFERKEDLVDAAKYVIVKGTLVLVKASRSIRLEEIIESLKELTAI